MFVFSIRHSGYHILVTDLVLLQFQSIVYYPTCVIEGLLVDFGAPEVCWKKFEEISEGRGPENSAVTKGLHQFLSERLIYLRRVTISY